MTTVLPPPSPSDLLPPPPPPPAPTRSRRRRVARRHSAYDVIFIGAVCYLVAALLNAPGLYERAKDLPFGTRRDVLVALSGGLVGVSELTGLDVPTRVLDAVGGRDGARETDSAVVALPEVDLPATPTSAVRPPSTTAAPSSPPSTWAEVPPDRTRPGATAAPTTTATTAAPTTTVAPTTTTTSPYLTVRVPTSDAPLRVWVGGDSLSEGLGWSFQRLGADTGLVAATEAGEVSSGLARPDFYNWPAEIQRVVAEDNPEVVVVMFGANDPQAVQNEAGSFRFGTPEWEAEYRLRVRTVMALGSQGRRLIWIGEPVVRDGALDAKMQVIDRLQREEAAAFPNVSFIDARTLFLGPDGGYTEVLPTPDGGQVDLRADDGVHPNNAGYDRLASLAMAEILRLTDPTEATLPTPAAVPGTAALI